MFSTSQRGAFRGTGRPGIKVNTQYDYVTANPVGWTSDEVTKYITRHSRVFSDSERLSNIVVANKLTGRYFVEMDREGFREAANTVLSGENELSKDFKRLWDLLLGKAKRTSPVVQPRSPVWDIFSPVSPL